MSPQTEITTAATLLTAPDADVWSQEHSEFTVRDCWACLQATFPHVRIHGTNDALHGSRASLAGWMNASAAAIEGFDVDPDDIGALHVARVIFVASRVGADTGEGE